MEKSIIPENDMQDLWKLSGRVEAVIAYIKAETYMPDKNIIIKMLGGAEDIPLVQDAIIRVVPKDEGVVS